MTTDDLDSKSDRELDELFAVEVGCHIRPAKGHRLIAEDGYLLILDRKGKRVSKHATPAVTTDANAVLPWLEKWHDADVQHRDIRICRRTALDWLIALRMRPHAMAEWQEPFDSVGSFARAAVIALLKAKRAEKSA